MNRRYPAVFFDFGVQPVDPLRNVEPTVGVVRRQMPQQKAERRELASVDDIVQAADVDALVADAEEARLRHDQPFAARALGIRGKAVGQQRAADAPQGGRGKRVGGTCKRFAASVASLMR